MGRRRRRWGRPVLYTVALVAIGLAGASAVYLRGSAQRRDDRAAVVAYEQALLPLVREGGRIVQQEMKPSLREISDGEITGEMLLGRAGAWRAVFTRVRAGVVALDPPGFLAAIRPRWAAAMDGYLAAIAAFEALARAPAGPERERLAAEAGEAGERADDLFDRAAELIQLHRRRLGLGPSANLPDATSEPSGS